MAMLGNVMIICYMNMADAPSNVRQIAVGNDYVL